MTEKQNKDEVSRQRRVDNYNKQCKRLIEAGYVKKERIISVLKANVMAFVTAGPLALAACFLYFMRWNLMVLTFGYMDILFAMLLMIGSIPIHELLHGLAWSLFCKGGWKSIHLGIMRKSMTPYCHCKEPLSFRAYITGGLMPFLVLGAGIFLAAYLTGSVMLLFLSVLNILAAGGDTTIALMLLRHRRAVIIDHPNECGFAAFEKESAA